MAISKLDPSSDDGGGAGGGSDPTESKGGAGSNSLSDEQLGAVADKVRVSLGLSEGQKLNDMVTGTVNMTVRSTFGLEKGDNAMEKIGATIAATLLPQLKPKDDKGGSKGDAGKDGEIAELKKQVEDVTGLANDLKTQAEGAVTQGLIERRNSLVRTALGEFQISTPVKDLVINHFLSQSGPRLSEDGKELVMIDANDATTPFAAHLKDYFVKNTAFIQSQNFLGSGADGGNGAGGGGGAYDPKTATSRAGADNFAAASANDPEGTIKKLQDSNKQKARGIY